MPISTTILLAGLAVMRWLFFAITGLFVVLAARAYTDPAITIGVPKALLGGGIFLITGIALGVLRGALVRRMKRK